MAVTTRGRDDAVAVRLRPALRHTVAVSDPALPDRPRTEIVLLWLARLAWIGVGVGTWAMVDELGLDGAAQVAVGSMTGAVWLAGVAGLSVPAVLTLTIARIAVPTSIPGLIVVGATADDIDAAIAIATVAAALAAAVVVARPEFGRLHVQASAYGREDRHLLRAPPDYVLAAALAWSLATGAWVGAAVSFAAEIWWLGALLAAIAVALFAFSAPRWHRLSRRWFVLLPSGVVIHDHLVLAETLMIPKHHVSGLRLAPADTDAADLTGPAAGHAVELLTREPVTAIRAATPATPGGSAIHLRACLIAPTRPGRALTAAQRYRYPVG